MTKIPIKWITIVKCVLYLSKLRAILNISIEILVKNSRDVNIYKYLLKILTKMM